MSSPPTAHRLFATRSGSGVLFDAAIAGAALVGSLALISHFPGSGADADLDGLGVLLAVCASAPLLVWRRSPMAVFAVIMVASALLVGLEYPLGLPLGACSALYLLAASRGVDDPWTRRSTAAVVVLFGVYAAAAGIGEEGFPASALFHGALALSIAWFAGERTRLRREQIAGLEERAVRAQRDAERERRLAVAEERVRIARDLHDAAGHALNVITVRAGAARIRRDPERSQATLELIEDVARQTAAEIDGIVGTLRDRRRSNGGADAPIGLASLDTLIANYAAAGLDVSVHREGMPQPLESATDQAAYRIMQEALTNAARHGTGPACVELTFGMVALGLTISNPAPRNRASSANGGHGLIGMRERVTLLGGRFDAQHADGSFRVSASLPYQGPGT